MQTNFSYPACSAGTLAPPLFAGLHSYLALFSPAQLRLLTPGQAGFPLQVTQGLALCLCFRVLCVILVCPVGKTGAHQRGIVPMFLPPKDVIAFCDFLLSSDPDSVDPQVQPQLPPRLPGPGPFFACVACEPSQRGGF